MFRKVDRILLRVTALPAAIAYYRDQLGLELINADHRVASFRMGEAELVLHADPDLPAQGVYFLVDDVRALYARRETLGLRFISAPKATARGYTATVKDPQGTVLLLLDRSAGEAASAAVEDAAAPGTLFPGVEPRQSAKPERLIAAYERIRLTADDLPYTPQFETLYLEYASAFDPKPSRAEAWRHLLNLRKSGKLPKLGEARSVPPEIDDDDRARLLDLIGDDLGRRDRLPYSDRFNQIVDAFNAGRSRPISPHHVWRLVATLAK